MLPILFLIIVVNVMFFLDKGFYELKIVKVVGHSCYFSNLFKEQNKCNNILAVIIFIKLSRTPIINLKLITIY